MKTCCGLAIVLAVALLSTTAVAGPELTPYRFGNVLANAPDYQWWFGCTPTSAGMLMGYYDRNGYGNLDYANIMPGGVAELDTYPMDLQNVPVDLPRGPSIYAANDMIASPGHITDFFTGDYGAIDDDADPLTHEFDCLADFMGTSQENYPYMDLGNGGTWLWAWDTVPGDRLHYYNLPGYGIAEYSGMYGIYEYLDYRGYGDHVLGLFNQTTSNLTGEFFGYDGPYVGFTFEDYMREVDAGRPVLLHILHPVQGWGHSVFAFGYDEAEQLVYLHDTWDDPDQTDPVMHSMEWTGDYYGAVLFMATALQLEIPEPGTTVLFAAGLCGMLGVWSRRRRKV
jgi:hypothetical protein